MFRQWNTLARAVFNVPSLCPLSSSAQGFATVANQAKRVRIFCFHPPFPSSSLPTPPPLSMQCIVASHSASRVSLCTHYLNLSLSVLHSLSPSLSLSISLSLNSLSQPRSLALIKMLFILVQAMRRPTGPPWLISSLTPRAGWGRRCEWRRVIHSLH